MRRALRGELRVAVLALALGGCAPTINLLNPTSPKFEGTYALSGSRYGAVASTRIRVVSFNIKLADEIGRAIEVLRSDSLRDADIISLQEMDDAGVERIAQALHLNYVYYPGSIHPTRHRYFGPAILTRWPIEQSWKLLLPHEAPIRHQRRNATAATLRVRGSCLRVYAVHLETQLRATAREREGQAATILADAAETTCPVIVAGDFNSKGIGEYFEQQDDFVLLLGSHLRSRRPGSGFIGRPGARGSRRQRSSPGLGQPDPQRALRGDGALQKDKLQGVAAPPGSISISHWA